ncbi:MAG: tRNA sulfurtransferase [Candidatus Nanosalina sp.]
MSGKDTVVARYGEIGTKSDKVRSDMVMVLRQRVQDRLEYEDIEYEKVSSSESRIVCRGIENPQEAAEKISQIPGVATVSPVFITDPELDKMTDLAEEIVLGRTFGVDASTAGQHSFDSQDVERELGSALERSSDSAVDLDNPETLVEVDVRPDEAYVFSERFEGPQGFPVGTGEELAALISGGIDSPVAAYRAMCRGSKITPVYFYNRPIAAEDHLLRFKAVVRELKKFNPSRTWRIHVVDMGEVNERLLAEIDRGRMLVHRRIMFRVAEKIKQQQNLSGIVTGESIAQKSSQTASNLEITSKAVETSIFRPLLTENKYDIVSQARDIGTFENSKIESACNSLSPENPATKIDEEEIQSLEDSVDVERLVDKALEKTETEVL